MNELEQKLSVLQTELKSYFDKAAEETKTRGSMLEETKNAVTALQKQVDAIDSQLAQRAAAIAPKRGLEQALKENDSVQRLMKDRSGRAVIHLKGREAAQVFEHKTTITESAIGFATTGVLPIERTVGIRAEPRQTLRIRDLLSSRPTTAAIIDFVRVGTPLVPALPVVEASLKPENALTFTAASEKVRTIATWIPATKQILDDFTELRGFLDTALPYYVDKAEETELLSGDGTGEHLHGLIPQALAFDTSLLSTAAGWNRFDQIGRAIQQIEVANEIAPGFVVLHPNDWWSMRLTKDSFGRYILGDPQNATDRPQIFGSDLVSTTSISPGTFLVGSGSPVASEIRDREDTTIEISTEHADFFVRNMVAIRAEKRVALVVYRPHSYVTGTFTTSP